MKVDIDYVLKMMEERRVIDSKPLAELEFYRNGERIEVSEDLINDWNYTGLGNFFFIHEHFSGEPSSVTTMIFTRKEDDGSIEDDSRDAGN